MAEKEKAVFKVFIKGTMEAVWREITKEGEPQGCFFNMQLHTSGLKPGNKMQMRTASGKYTGAVGEVLEYDPPYRYAHTFRFTQYDDPPCKVIYELKKVRDGVEFVMTLEDLPAGTKTAKQMKQGGAMIVNTLKRIVETGKPSMGIRMLYQLFKVMEPLTPKKCRSENWSM
jgi:uncharacterized protein YndB with AHSA1/START domain